MNRTDLRLLVSAAFTTGRTDFARAACQAWLNLAPGDLGVRFDLARAYAAENNVDDALKALIAVTNVDLEQAAAYQLMATLAPKQAVGLRAAANAYVLNGHPFPEDLEAPIWMASARHAVIALSGKHYDTAREQIDIALRDDPSLPLLSLILLQTHWQAQELDLALPLAKGFHDRWPQAAAFSLCLIDGLFNSGAGHQAVELLHTVSAQDAGADVVNRYWGKSHPYRDLWPQVNGFNLPGPIPADIITLLGLNRIGGSTAAPSKVMRPAQIVSAQAPQAPKPKHAPTQPATPKSADLAKARLENDINNGRVPRTPILKNIMPLPEREGPPLYPVQSKGTISEELADIESALTTVASEIGTARANRKPVHVILFSPKLLTAKFGPEGAEQVLKLVGDLGKITAKRRKVTVVLLSPEAPADEHGLKAVDPTKAYDVKMQLHDLDQKLGSSNQAIGSLLIIGGDDLVPFHRLPNPTDDVDEDVPSDNPYGTTDENYFIPEWPVGRLPSPCGRDAEPLCAMLRTTIAAHNTQAEATNWFMAFILRLLQRQAANGPLSSMGYSASIWKDASEEVFAAIGKSADLQMCPPADSDHAPALDKSQLSYFNLHGVEDGPNWYGQRTQADGYGPLYPVALSPKSSGKSLPKVIFTEACYGANIINKTEPDAALCLRFLTDGVQAFVGSTRIAYGSVSAPLIGADMLGRLFWENVLSGLPMGEALRYAKLNLAHAMHKRQSFLDGEDQKTLIAFQLYGDPLLPMVSTTAGKRLFGKVKKVAPTVKTVAMEYATDDNSPDLQPETVAEIKFLLSQYLPGSESATVSLSRPLSPIRAKSKTPPTHRVYTFAKNIHTSTAQTLPTFARVTVNKAGKVVKLAVSR